LRSRGVTPPERCSVDLTPYRDFAVELAERSGDLIRPYFGADASTLGIELKADESIVTRADRDAEALMRGLIGKRFPAHGILGEEYGAERPDAEFVWVLDPIDGTISFASASPLFGTLIALVHHGTPVLGAINQPVLRQLCLGDGATTSLNGAPVRVREPRPLSQATLLVTDVLSVAKHQNGAAFDALMRRYERLVHKVAAGFVPGREAALDLTQAVFLRADQSVPYGTVATVVDTLRQAGIQQISMVTEPLNRSR